VPDDGVPVGGPNYTQAPKETPLNIFRPDPALHMLSMTADDLVIACGAISRQEDLVAKALRAVNLEAPTYQHSMGTGIGELYCQRDILQRLVKRRDFGRIGIKVMNALETKVRILQLQTNLLLADVELLASNIDTARSTAGGVVRSAKRDYKAKTAVPY
jgi:hypothetical protein